VRIAKQTHGSSGLKGWDKRKLQARQERIEKDGGTFRRDQAKARRHRKRLESTHRKGILLVH